MTTLNFASVGLKTTFLLDLFEKIGDRLFDHQSIRSFFFLNQQNSSIVICG